MTVLDKIIIAAIKNADVMSLTKVKPYWLDDFETKRFTYVMDYFKAHGELMGLKTYCNRFSLDADEADSRP